MLRRKFFNSIASIPLVGGLFSLNIEDDPFSDSNPLERALHKIFGWGSKVRVRKSSFTKAWVEWSKDPLTGRSGARIRLPWTYFDKDDNESELYHAMSPDNARTLRDTLSEALDRIDRLEDGDASDWRPVTVDPDDGSERKYSDIGDPWEFIKK